MKVKIIRILFILMSLYGGNNMYAQTENNAKKTLIVYYSLRNGNTRIVAEHIQKNVGGDLVRIETVDSYPEIYRDVTTQAKKELESGYRPPLKTHIKNFDDYDTIFLGSPNWWNTIAPAVMTFLESYNFAGKTVVPFITHEGSRLGKSVDDIEKLAPEATMLRGLSVRGSSVNDAMGDVKTWLKNLK